MEKKLFVQVYSAVCKGSIINDDMGEHHFHLQPFERVWVEPRIIRMHQFLNPFSNGYMSLLGMKVEMLL